MFVDIHSHMVPAVDDGSQSIAETIDNFQLLYREGVTRLVTTPHFAFDPEAPESDIVSRLDTIQFSFDALARACEGLQEMPVFLLGQELYSPSPEYAQRVVGMRRVGIADTQYMLVEFGFGPLDDPEGVIQTMLDAGRIPVIAHPERYQFGNEAAAVKRVGRWMEMGCVIQINLGSLFGYYERWSPRSEDVAWALIERGVVNVLASDHHGTARSQILHQETLTTLTDKMGRDQVLTWMNENPGRIISGEPILRSSMVAI